MRIGPSHWTLAGVFVLAETLCAVTLFAAVRWFLAAPPGSGPPFGLATLWLTVTTLCLFWALAARRLAGPLTETPVLAWHMALVLVTVVAFAGGLLVEDAAERSGAVAFFHLGATRTAGIPLLLAGNAALFVPWLALLRSLAKTFGWRGLYLKLNWLFVSASASMNRPPAAAPAVIYGLAAERARRRAMIVFFVFAILLALLVAYVRTVVEHG